MLVAVAMAMSGGTRDDTIICLYFDSHEGEVEAESKETTHSLRMVQYYTLSILI